MISKIAEFINLIDQALEFAQQERTKPEQTEQIDNVITKLQSIKTKFQNGQIEPSAGQITLGLTREVSDWIESLDSPLLTVLGQLEQYYQNNF